MEWVEGGILCFTQQPWHSASAQKTAQSCGGGVGVEEYFVLLPTASAQCIGTKYGVGGDREGILCFSLNSVLALNTVKYDCQIDLHVVCMQLFFANVTVRIFIYL